MPWISRVVAPADSPRNGFVPDASSYKTMPREKISLAAVMGRCKTSSGDMYPRVPSGQFIVCPIGAGLPGESEVENLYISVGAEHEVLRLDVPMNDAAGVRRVEGVGDLRVPREPPFRAAGPCRKNAAARYPSPVPWRSPRMEPERITSCTVTMFGWFRAEAACASRMNRSEPEASSFTAITFRATSRFRSGS